MQLQLLTLSLGLAAGLAMLFVKLILWLGLKEQLNYVIPLLPVFYAIVYPLFEKSWEKRHPAPVPPYVFHAAPRRRFSGRLAVVLLGVAVSFAVHMAWQAWSWSLADRVAGRSRPFDSALAFQWLLAEGPGLPEPWKAVFLGGELLAMTAVGGLIVGLLSPSAPLANGLLAGVIVAMGIGAGQTDLASSLLMWTSDLGARLKGDWQWYYGLSGVLFLQAFLFALFSGQGARLRVRLTSGRRSLP